MTSRVTLQINRVLWTWGKEKDKSQGDDSHLFCRLETGRRSQAAGISAKGHAYSGEHFSRANISDVGTSGNQSRSCCRSRDDKWPVHVIVKDFSSHYFAFVSSTRLCFRLLYSWKRMCSMYSYFSILGPKKIILKRCLRAGSKKNIEP